MSEARAVDRLVTFTDAVVAIAITLLVLPLADLVSHAASRHESSLDVITKNQWQIYSFLLSFAVIARLWIGHHHIFEKAKAYNHLLMVCNLGWILTIVVLPFPTDMIGGFGGDRFVAGFYIGTVLASNILQLLMIMIINNDPDVAKDAGGVGEGVVFRSASGAVALAVALILAVFVPGVTYYGLFLVAVPVVLNQLRRRRVATAGAQEV